MSGGWTEDPELAKLRSTVAQEAQSEKERIEKLQRETDAFVSKYQALIIGGLGQALDILNASKKYGGPRIDLSKYSHSHEWRVIGEKWGERTDLLELHLSNGMVSFWSDATNRVEREDISLDEFSEQWFRERLRALVRALAVEPI